MLVSVISVLSIIKKRLSSKEVQELSCLAQEWCRMSSFRRASVRVRAQ